MSIDWARIAEIAAPIGAVLGFGGRQAYLKGKFDQRMKDVEGRVGDVENRVSNHDSRLGDGAVAFGRIDEKLDNLKESHAAMRRTVEDGLKEMRSILLDHISGGGK